MATSRFSSTLAALAAPRLLADSSGDAGVDLSNYLVLKNGDKVSEVFKTPASMVNLLVSNAFVVAGGFIFVLILIGGFKFLSDEAKGLDEAKTLWTNAGIGFAVLFGAYWVVQIVQILTGVQILF
jgi:hypothetical protein